MNFNADSLINGLLGALGGGSMAFWLLRRFVGRVDGLEVKITALEVTVQNLATKEHVASKEDLGQVSQRLTAVETALGDIKVMLGRLDERWKLHNGG